MCYHIAFDVKLDDITDLFPGLVINDDMEIVFPTASYVNGFNHGMHTVMLLGRKDGKKHLAKMMWGYVPNGIKNMEEAARFWNGYVDKNGKYIKGYVTLNAVGEELLQKKLYREAALTRRCIVFTDGFYEWRHVFPLNKRTGQPLKTAVKYPYHIKFKQEKVIMMAGVWNPWKHEEADTTTGELVEYVTPTFAIVTAPANKLMEQVHNSKMRMPTILTKELAEEWISKELTEERIVEIATNQYAAGLMEAYSIPKDFQEIANPKAEFKYEDLERILC